jgi:molecular chaperone HscC
MIIGIDLGTTNSVAAHLTPDGPRLIPNVLGEVLTPSVVGIDPQGNVLVGRAAQEYQVVHPGRCASLFKRYMGTDWTFTCDRRTFTPEQLSSLVLASLRRDAEVHLHQPVTQAVVTVPAYFNDSQRKATIRAGQLAGLHMERIINEPTAAAIAYGLHQSREERIAAVFDLGGGTFDVSIVEHFEGAIEVRASSGECFLGGEDFTRALAARVLESRGILFERAELEMPLLISRMFQQCERAKRQLTSQDAVTIRIPDRNGEIGDNADTLSVSREQFQKWTEHILNRIELPIRRGLGDANLKRSDIGEVILVGGATRMPAVVQRVTDIFQKTPHSSLNPDEVVALGAAVQAGLMSSDESLGDMVVTDVSPFTLGISISKRFGSEVRDGYFLPVIPRNTTIPNSRVERVATMHANQAEVKVHVFQGESRQVKDNLELGEFSIKGIPRGPAGQEIDIRFTYDLNGVLEVEAVIVETRTKASLVITRYAKGIKDHELQKALAEMATLKQHPREETGNHFLLRRAERVYRELPEHARLQLADLLDGFEQSLADRDPEIIIRFREELEIFLSAHDEQGLDGDLP